MIRSVIVSLNLNRLTKGQTGMILHQVTIAPGLNKMSMLNCFLPRAHGEERSNLSRVRVIVKILLE